MMEIATRENLGLGTNMIAGVLILPAKLAWWRLNFVTRYRTAAASEARMVGARTS